MRSLTYILLLIALAYVSTQGMQFVLAPRCSFIKNSIFGGYRVAYWVENKVILPSILFFIVLKTKAIYIGHFWLFCYGIVPEKKYL